jgi:hypothetical protein
MRACRTCLRTTTKKLINHLNDKSSLEYDSRNYRLEEENFTLNEKLTKKAREKKHACFTYFKL